MENFIERKQAYLEKLRSNEYLLDAILAQKGKSAEVTAMIINPQDEGELTIADKIVTFVGDILNMMIKQGERDYDGKDMTKKPIINYFVRTIIAFKNSDKEALEAIKQEISQIPSADFMADMFYDFISITTYDAEAMTAYLFEQTGFNHDKLSLAQFEDCFKRANSLIIGCLPSMETIEVEDMKNLETAKFYNQFIDRFHSLYQRDYENKNKLGM